jgi:hypothetical protein
VPPPPPTTAGTLIPMIAKSLAFLYLFLFISVAGGGFNGSLSVSSIEVI